MLLLSLCLTITGILFIWVFPLRIKSLATFFIVLINAILTSFPSIQVLTGNNFEYIFSDLTVFGDIVFRIDPLSAWFILIINFTVINGALYGIGYMKPYLEQKSNTTMHWMVYLIFHSSMIWVCIIQNSLLFLIIWEIMSLSSLILVIFEHSKSKNLKAGINYLVQMHIGVVFLTIAFIWVYFSEKSFDFTSIAHFFSTHSNLWLFLLLFIGFGIKAGFTPFHSWLPHAHPAAPSHISGVMSGVIVKLGIYGIFRMMTFLKADFNVIGQSIIILSIITGLFGILNSVVQRNYKKLLAYCTIENIGIIGIGMGIGIIGLEKKDAVLIIMGFGGALLHTLNHSLFKSLLFFSAGSVYQQTHTRNMEKLGGLIKKMPQTALLFLAGSLAIGGMPPFNGFISEFILYKGMLEGIQLSGFYNVTLLTLSFASLAIIGGISIIAFTKSFGTIFLGAARTHLHSDPVEVPFYMRLPQYIILVVMISIGIFPFFYFKPVLEIVNNTFLNITTQELITIKPFLKTLSNVGIYSAVFIALLLLMLFIRKIFSRKNTSLISSTWGCGYVAPKVSMQYSGKSFSKSLGKMFGEMLSEKKKYKEISTGEIFPKKRDYSSNYVDFFEDKIIDKINNRLLYFMNLFQFVQNGNMQMYILYGIFFIILVFIGTLFNFI